jgi:hypothetical protein
MSKLSEEQYKSGKCFSGAGSVKEDVRPVPAKNVGQFKFHSDEYFFRIAWPLLLEEKIERTRKIRAYTHLTKVDKDKKKNLRNTLKELLPLR